MHGPTATKVIDNKYIIDFAGKTNISAVHWALGLCVDIESFWTEGYAGQTWNSGCELAIYYVL